MSNLSFHIGPRVLHAAAAATEIPAEHIAGEARTQTVCAVRAAVALVLRDAGWSLPRIGRLLGGRNHTTILHLLRGRERWLRWETFEPALLAARAAAASPGGRDVCCVHCGQPLPGAAPAWASAPKPAPASRPGKNWVWEINRSGDLVCRPPSGRADV